MLGKRFAGGILDSSLVMPERALVHVMVSKVLQATSTRDEALRTHRPNTMSRQRAPALSSNACW